MSALKKLLNEYWWFVPLIFFFSYAVGFGFPDSPSPWFDEGINLGIAKTYVNQGVYSLGLGNGEVVDNRPLMISTNWPLLGWIILSFKIFGIGLASAKAVMILFLLTYLILTFALIKKIFSARAAAWSVALLITFLPFYGNGLSGGLGEVPGLVYLLAALLLWEKENSWHIALAGLFFGLAITTKVFYLVLLLPLGLAEVYRAIQMRQVLLKRWLLLSVGIVVCLLIWLRTLLPASLAEEMTERLQAAAAYYRNPYNAERNIGANLKKFFSDSTLVHFALAFVAYYTYIVQKIIKERRLSPLHILLGAFVLLNLLYFVRSPGWFRYLFPAHLLLLTLLPGALLNLTAQYKIRWMTPATLAIIIFLTGSQTLHFFNERSTRLYYNREPRAFAEVLVRRAPDLSQVYIVDHPELWFLLPSLAPQQFLHMNPHVAFGEHIGQTRHTPQYVIIDYPEVLFTKPADLAWFKQNYILFLKYGRYVVYSKR